MFGLKFLPKLWNPFKVPISTSPTRLSPYALKRPFVNFRFCNWLLFLKLIWLFLSICKRSSTLIPAIILFEPCATVKCASAYNIFHSEQWVNEIYGKHLGGMANHLTVSQDNDLCESWKGLVSYFLFCRNHFLSKPHQWLPIPVHRRRQRYPGKPQTQLPEAAGNTTEAETKKYI